MLNRFIWSLIACVPLLAGVPALAQTPPPQIVGGDTPPPAAASQPVPQKDALEEIVVTAEHRSEDISKVPMSITALTGDQMEQQGIKNIADIAREVPGLNFQSSGDSFGTTEISLRGINSQTGAAPTGIYIDDTPIQVRLSGFTATTNPYPKVFDLERVEVLKGPQGTLFGAGSEGGTVRFITPEPSLTEYTGLAHVDGSFSVAGDPSWEAGAAVGGPIIPDKLGFRASAWVQDTGGWVDRVDGKTGDVVDPNSNWQLTKVARVSFKAQPTDELTITPSFFYQDTYTHDTDLWWLPGTDYPYAHGGRYNNESQLQQPDDDGLYLAGLNVEYKFDAFTVKSISSYFYRKDTRNSDGSTFDLSTFVPYPLDSGPGGYGGIALPDGAPFVSHYFLQNGQQNFDEELRFTSNTGPDDRFAWSGGLFWEHNKQVLHYSITEPLINVANDPAVIANEQLGCAPGSCTVADLMGVNDVGQNSYLDNDYEYETEEAIYGNISYRITPELKLEAGVRAARSVFDYHEVQDGPWNAHLLADGVTYVGLSENSATKKEYPITPRFSASYQITDDQLVYATAAKGYRIGGGNDDLSTVAACDQDFQNLGITGNPKTYNSDSVWSYEVGTKEKLLDHHLEIDAAAFWINWTNIQSQVYLPICGYTYTQNLGDAVSRGFELTATWVVNDALTLSGNVAYTDAHYTTTTSVGGNILALSGDSLGTPPLTFTVSAQHAQDLGNDMSLYMRADFEYASHFTRTGSDLVYTFDGITRNGLATTNLTARVGVTKGPWDVSLYGQNVLNSDTITYLYHDTTISPGVRAESQTPTTVGVTADYKF